MSTTTCRSPAVTPNHPSILAAAAAAAAAGGGRKASLDEAHSSRGLELPHRAVVTAESPGWGGRESDGERGRARSDISPPPATAVSSMSFIKAGSPVCPPSEDRVEESPRRPQLNRGTQITRRSGDRGSFFAVNMVRDPGLR